MTSALTTIALCAPIVASNAVFSVRRASRGMDSIADNPIYGAMNMDIAAAQTLKGARAAKVIADASSYSLEAASGATEAIKNLSNTNKFVSGLSQVVNFTADHINPIICATSGVKVLYADDKVDAAARESLALGAMFGAENLAKKALGMPVIKTVNKQKVSIPREALYKKNPFINEQVTALKDYCATKKLFNKISLKFVPGAIKGLAFVGASIAG